MRFNGALKFLLLTTLAAQHTALAKAGPAAHWIASWAASQQAPEPQNALPPDQLRNATLREIVHLSQGGAQLRVRLSNAFGTQPLHLTAVHVARSISPSQSAIDAASDHSLCFNGQPDVTIPAGADYLSDPIDFKTAPLSNLAITLTFDAPPQGETSHPGSHANSYLSAGNHIADRSLPDAKKFEHWFQLSGVDIAAPAAGAAIVAFGDSITDGHGSTTDANNRWPDDLAARLQHASANHSLGVVNEGIGGNRLLLDGLGPNALARFDRDVLAQTAVRYVIVLEGINDLGNATKNGELSQDQNDHLVDSLIGAYRQMIERAHAHDILIYGATITPDGQSPYYHPGTLSEQDRQKINHWIRTPGNFDAVIDFDKVIRDPRRPDQMLPAFDSGDHLHPSPAGYQAMAKAIPFSLFSSSSRLQ